MDRLRWMSRIGAIAMIASTPMVTAGPVHATYPARNGLIVFAADTGEGPQLYTVRPNGKELRQITDLAEGAGAPDWSPDGSRIVFGLGGCTIAFVDPDGSNVTPLPQGEPHANDVCEGDPSFTPDGSQIVFSRFDPVLEDEAIWIMDVDGSDRRRVAASPGGGTDPNVSPDGRTVSLLGFLPDGPTALFAAGIDGSGVHQVGPALYGIAFKHDWAPDGRHLVVTDNADDVDHPANVATMRPDGTGLHYVTDLQATSDRAYVGSYSPDGAWIVFRLENGDSFELCVVRPDGRALRVVLPFSDFKPRFIDWGPAVS
jgi:Tol biopolymer transport system component